MFAMTKEKVINDISIMKKIVLLISFIIPLMAVAQPKKWNGKAMCEFGNDTVVYLKYNLKTEHQSAQEYFRGKTVGDVIKELGINVKRVNGPAVATWDSLSYIWLLVVRKDKYTYGVRIDLETPLPYSAGAALISRLNYGITGFCKEMFDLIKDLKVVNVFYGEGGVPVKMEGPGFYTPLRRSQMNLRRWRTPLY